MSPVIDAALTLGAILPGESQPALQACIEAWRAVEEPLYVPAAWMPQVASALARAAAKGALTPAEGRRALTLAQRLGVEIVAPTPVQAELAYAWALRIGSWLADAAFYLALAEILRSEFWTADAALHRAAGERWVRLATG